MSKRNVMLKMVLILVVALFLPLSARAGDLATVEVIGYSPDGFHFAFEQYGYQDGSGFPYCEIFFIDVDENSWAEKPVRVMVMEEQDIEGIRRQARTKAMPVLRKLGLDRAETGTVVFKVKEGDGYFLEDRPKSANIKLSGDTYELRVTETNLAATDDDIFGPAQSLKLKLTFGSGGSVVLQDDNGSVPSSRGQARNYSIYRVLRNQAAESYVVILAYHLPDFEGPGTRFMAVSFSQ